jgi:type I restriction enzyme R subunit
VLLQDRLKKGKERLDHALEAIELICEPVEPPKGELEHIHYFCGNTEVPSDLQEREPRRAALYKAVVALLRGYAGIADEMDAAGYADTEVTHIKGRLDRYVALREIIRKASGETLDLKAYEADMRHLIDTYIEAAEPRQISPFDNISLLELIVKCGIGEAVASLPKGMKASKDAVAETIENNVRAKIVKETLTDPAYYEKMSALLKEIIEARKAKAIDYEEYLKQIAELAKRVQAGKPHDLPAMITTPGKRALYNNLGQNEQLALAVDGAVRNHRPDGWRGVPARENVIKRAMYAVLNDEAEVERIFAIIRQQGEY